MTGRQVVQEPVVELANLGMQQCGRVTSRMLPGTSGMLGTGWSTTIPRCTRWQTLPEDTPSLARMSLGGRGSCPSRTRRASQRESAVNGVRRGGGRQPRGAAAAKAAGTMGRLRTMAPTGRSCPRPEASMFRPRSSRAPSRLVVHRCPHVAYLIRAHRNPARSRSVVAVAGIWTVQSRPASSSLLRLWRKTSRPP